jgi:hypothetical protein
MRVHAGPCKTHIAVTLNLCHKSNSVRHPTAAAAQPPAQHSAYTLLLLGRVSLHLSAHMLQLCHT